MRACEKLRDPKEYTNPVIPILLWIPDISLCIRNSRMTMRRYHDFGQLWNDYHTKFTANSYVFDLCNLLQVANIPFYPKP